MNQMKQMEKFARYLGADKVDFAKMSPTPYNQDIVLAGSPLGFPERRLPPACLNGWFYISVNSTGKLSICCEADETAEGNIEKESFKSIWLSPAMMKLRLLGKNGRIPRRNKACQTCRYHNGHIDLLQQVKKISKTK